MSQTLSHLYTLFECPQLANCCTLHFFLDRPKADLHKYNRKDALAVALENYFLAPFTAALSVAPAYNTGLKQL